MAYPGSWRTFVPSEEQHGYQRARLGEPEAFGRRPALLVIDCTFGFTGRPGAASIEEATRDFPLACGPSAWEALPRVADLVEGFRRAELPIVYTRADLSTIGVLGATKAARSGRRSPLLAPEANDFPDVLAPEAGELVLEKSGASAFFETPLATYLRTLRVDAVVACGATTSGCVRASVVDAHSHGFVTFVGEDATFDRSATAHRANLWDMDSKYASVLPCSQILQEVTTLSAT